MSLNIYEKFRNKNIQDKFQTEILGYHMVNEEPIKESTWEEINCNILKDFCQISDKAKGKHSSGKDNRFDDWNISNKTGKIEGEIIKISSYRLTTVCNDKNPGDIKDIITEITKRDESFDYFSLLLREEISNDTLNYFWYIIPKDYYPFNPEKADWKQKLGTRKKIGDVVGWESKNMEINFSMSSQLWYKFSLEDIEQCLIFSLEVNKDKLKRVSYSDIYLMK